MYQEGDYVYVNMDAEPDCNMLAWSYIKSHVRGQIRRVVQDKDLPAREALCAVEFPDQFAGGNDCATACLPKQGQWITAKNLDLDFEASRNVVTVPCLEVPDEEEYAERESNP